MATQVLFHRIAAAGLLLSCATSAVAGSSATCPTTSQLSCSNTTVVKDLCCFNAPGGQLVQTQFWDTDPASGPVDSWTVHGLWPDHCDGTYDANCDDTRAYTNITQILQAFGKTDLLLYMQTYWPDEEGDNESFWEHEWSKHGTCISTLKPSCYTNYVPTQEVPDFFQRTVDLFKTLPSYEWLTAAGIVPSSTVTYTSAQIEAALSPHHGNYAVTLGCSGSTLDEIWYHYHVQGSVQTGAFVAAAPDGTKSTCPATGIKYLPKGSTTSKTTTAGSTKASSTTPATATSTSTGAAFSGQGYLNVVAESTGVQNGCLIGAGSWYTTGTCATYTATAATGSSFTLKSSKGYCGVIATTFVCAAYNTAANATVFTASGNQLASANGVEWSADSTPSGSTQAKVYSNSKESVKILVEWQGL